MDFILEGKKATSKLDQRAFPKTEEGTVGHFSSRDFARKMGSFGRDSNLNYFWKVDLARISILGR